MEIHEHQSGADNDEAGPRVVVGAEARNIPKDQ